NVDGGDAAVLLRVALGDRDVDPIAVQLRPARVVVDERLGEAKLLRIERAPGVEILDLVPDLHQSISPGSSRNALTVPRNCAAVAPSRDRWSQVSVIVIFGSAAPTARIAACGGL